jgi:hypothetical protein
MSLQLLARINDHEALVPGHMTPELPGLSLESAGRPTREGAPDHQVSPVLSQLLALEQQQSQPDDGQRQSQSGPGSLAVLVD